MSIPLPTVVSPSAGLIRVGPAGWGSPTWEGTVFPSPLPVGFQPLEFLSERFDTVEIGWTFYNTPRPELAEMWARQVRRNPQFRFTARLNRQFTHERELSDEAVTAFSEGLRPLLDQGRLGCVLMQFPSSFRFTTENKAFLIQLRRKFHQFPLAAELRHASWNYPEALGTLIDYHISFCNLDQPQTVAAMPPASHLTWRTAYFKLHGRRCGPGFDQFDDRPYRGSGNDYVYSLEELAAWRTRAEQVARFSESAYVIFGNDAGGRSVINALQMKGLCEATAAPAAPRQLQTGLFTPRAA